MKLREYQSRCVDAVLDEFQRVSSTLVVLPTGTGKTVMFAHVIDRMRSRGRCKVLAHREELIFQARDKIEKVTGIRPDVEMASMWASERGLFGQKSPVVVSTVQTQNAGGDGEGRKARFDPDEFILVIVDEAHHATADSYRKVIDYYRQNPKLKVLGVTATPDRHDEEALGQVFGSVAFEYGIVDAIGDGWLTPIRQQVVSVSDLDLSQVRTTAGDLNGADLAKVLEFEKNLHGMVSPTLEIVGERKTLIFAASIAQAERIAEIINRHKPNSAECIFGNTEKDRRREILRQYATGMFQFLVNVGVATEGFDAPDIDVVVMGRPTESRALYAQMLGRGTRPLPGVVDPIESPDGRRDAIAASAKPSLLVLDFVGNAGRHKLIHAADILGGNYSDNVVARAKREIERKGKDADVSEELKKAEREQREEAAKFEEAKRRTLKFGVKHTARDVNPFDVLDLTPAREPGWHRGREPSPKMIEMLEKQGIQDPERLSFVQAGQLCGEIIKRWKEKRPSFRQSRLLQRFGYETKDMLGSDAKRLIDALKANGWRRPPEEAVA